MVYGIDTVSPLHTHQQITTLIAAALFIYWNILLPNYDRYLSSSFLTAGIWSASRNAAAIIANITPAHIVPGIRKPIAKATKPSPIIEYSTLSLSRKAITFNDHLKDGFLAKNALKKSSIAAAVSIIPTIEIAHWLGPKTSLVYPQKAQAKPRHILAFNFILSSQYNFKYNTTSNT